MHEAGDMSSPGRREGAAWGRAAHRRDLDEVALLTPCELVQRLRALWPAEAVARELAAALAVAAGPVESVSGRELAISPGAVATFATSAGGLEFGEVRPRVVDGSRPSRPPRPLVFDPPELPQRVDARSEALGALGFKRRPSVARQVLSFGNSSSAGLMHV
jgi:hypothetical protein